MEVVTIPNRKSKIIDQGVLVACWPAIERLQVQAPLGSGFFSPMSILSSTLKNEEVLITASFRGDVKPLVPGINISYSSLLIK